MVTFNNAQGILDEFLLSGRFKRGTNAIFGIVIASWNEGQARTIPAHRTIWAGGRDKRPHCLSLQRRTIFPFVTAAGTPAEDGSSLPLVVLLQRDCCGIR
jgi:hypothetical protein